MSKTIRYIIILSMLLSAYQVASKSPTPKKINSYTTIKNDFVQYYSQPRDTHIICELLNHNPNDSVLGIFSKYTTGQRTVTYFDPSLCAGETGPFSIEEVSFPLYGPDGFSWPVEIDIVIYDAPDSSCGGPQDELLRYSVVCDSATFAFPNSGTIIFPEPICVENPFYAGIEYVETGAGTFPSVIFDTEFVPDTCDNWQYFVGQWWEWSLFWTPSPGYPFFTIGGDTNSTACCIELDLDLICDSFDNCLNLANPDQLDSDGDQIGDACDDCIDDAYNDIDGDGLCADADNCPGIYNPLQEDTNTNDIGDICESCCLASAGNINYDLSDNLDISDLTYLVDYFFKGGAPPPCMGEADIDGSGGATPVDIADLTSLVDFLFKGGDAPASCL